MASLTRFGCSAAVVLLALSCDAGNDTSDSTTSNVETDGREAQIGHWDAVMKWPLVAIHTHLLPNGKILFWDRGNTGAGPLIDKQWGPPQLWDPTRDAQSKQITPTARVDYEPFCVGHAFLADGRLLVVGGHKGGDSIGEDRASIYDPSSNQWRTVTERMNQGRWYPTATTLANGDVLVTSGSSNPGEMNPLPQIFDASTETWRSLSNAQRELPFYPFMHVAPNGKVFMAGPEQTSRYLDTLGFGQLTDVARSQFSFRDYGSSLMYDAGKVMILGGSPGAGGQGAPTNTVETIDLNQDPPQWRSAQSMKHARRMQSAVALPDGTVLVTGGTSAPGFNDASGAVLEPELFNPATNQWTPMREMSERRIYHSIALLLPDARVLVAGGGQPFGTGLPAGQEDHHLSAQIFSPPYLFKGGRPELRSAPSTIGYAQPFEVDTDNAARIRMVRLMRLGSITHAFDHNARSMALAFKVAGNRLSITPPASPFIAPPGDYMLFLVDDRGAPSSTTRPNGNILRLAPSAGPFCDVSFQTTFDGTQPGDTVAVVGDGPELGNGDPFASRLRLSADGTFPRWKGTFKLTQSRDYRYRLVVLKANRGDFTFEADRVRTLTVGAQDNCSMNVDLNFGN